MKMISADFHVHHDYSRDAEGDIGAYCDRAVLIGLDSICFTTHYDVNPRRTERDGSWKRTGKRERISDFLVNEYIREAFAARKKYRDRGLSVHCGLEIDYFPGVEKEAERLKAGFPFDFIIGSVHCLTDIAISDPEEAVRYFHNISVGRLADDYFALLLAAASCPAFDCLGHLDYYVRYCRKYFGDDMNNIEIERFDPVFDRLKSTGVGIEINTSPFKKGENGFHPARGIIDRAVLAGVTISSIGSDSHRPEDLGKGIAEAGAYLRQRGVIPESAKIYEKTSQKIL